MSAEAEELAVDAVKDGLEEISFSWVLAVKQLKESDNKRLVNVPLG